MSADDRRLKASAASAPTLDELEDDYSFKFEHKEDEGDEPEDFKSAAVDPGPPLEPYPTVAEAARSEAAAAEAEPAAAEEDVSLWDWECTTRFNDTAGWVT